jgi:CHASE2 domain-containing sensor protein
MVRRKKRSPRPRAKKRGTGGKRNVGWVKRIIRMLPGIVFTLLLIFLFSRLGVLHKLQTAVLDTRMRLAAAPVRSEVAIVEITDDDYRTVFGGKSPLDPAKLQLLINAVASGRPKIIGVDIDTSAPQFKQVMIDGKWPPIIWDREPAKVPEDENEIIEPLGVLGRDDPQLNASSGMPLLLDDAEDGMTRRYRRLIKTTEGLLPSFSWAIINRLPAEKTTALKPSTEKYVIRYAGDREGSHRFRLSASWLLEHAKDKGLPGDNPLKDKIVLIGGSYGNDDVHFTPLGPMYGMYVIAQVIETELQGGGDKAPNHATVVLLEIFEGVLVIVLFHSFHNLSFLKALALTLLSIILVAVFCSLLAFGSILQTTFFIPVLICVLIFEFSVEYRIEFVKKLLAIFRGTPHQGK